jgi:cbb3-type cytochrome oxidase subunit 3
VTRLDQQNPDSGLRRDETANRSKPDLNWFDAGLKALALFLFFIIVLAILLFVYNMFKGEPYDEDEEDFDFEDDEPFEPAPVAPPVKKEAPEELVEP